ncbi:MAG: 3-oxoacyl-[acyl-carrier-protein] synthase III C-terminal domain-containing protein [Aliishimia sp.]
MRLSTLAVHIPTARISTEDIVLAASGSLAQARVFQRMFGIDHVAAIPSGETLEQQFVEILSQLQTDHTGALPDTLLYVRGKPLQYAQGCSPIETLSGTHPFLRDVTRQYEVDQYNCAGLFWALDLAETLLVSGQSRRVVLLAGDGHEGFSPAARYVPGCTLMGDAFCGLIVDLEPKGIQLASMTLRTHPKFPQGRSGTVAEMGAFFNAHSDFITEVLQAAGFDWQGQQTLLPHNVNQLAWQDFYRQSGVSPERVRLSLLPDIGHCYVCDPFLLLAEELKTGRISENPAMLISVGMGGYVGACKVFPAGALHPNVRNTSHTDNATCL